jgi:thiamine biosynthesis lipoprotein ApbE
VLDPRTQHPVEAQGMVSVICEPAVRADALSTAMLVMGRAEARLFARRRPEIGVAWLEPAGPAVRAWIWNLDRLEPTPGRRVDWAEVIPAAKDR